MSLLSLQNYGEWYYTRYFPSVRILREKILKKSQDDGVTSVVMGKLEPLFIEKNIIESRVHTYISAGKSLYFVRQKLIQKKFDQLLVEEVLGQVKDLTDNPETYRKVIEERCRKAANKGFSRKRIQYELQGLYPQARTLIIDILDTYDERNILENKVLPRLMALYPVDVVIQKCIQAGFSAQDARGMIKEGVN